MLFAAEGRCLATSAWRIYERIADEQTALVAQGWEIDAGTEELFSTCCALLTGWRDTAA
jgi:hypothetical protein